MKVQRPKAKGEGRTVAQHAAAAIVFYFVLSTSYFASAQGFRYYKAAAPTATPAGNATVADVVVGKTFSSSTLINAVGTNTKNATIPGDAPIQPPQVFVDVMRIFSIYTPVDLTNRGITEFRLAAVQLWFAFFDGLDLSGNAISSAANVDQLLADVYSDNGSAAAPDLSIDISGGTNASPSAGAIDSNAWNLFPGYQVKFNLHGSPVTLHHGTVTADFSNNSMSASEINALLAFLVANHLVNTYTLDLSGGTNAAPTGQGLTDKQTLIDNGWTVTTN